MSGGAYNYIYARVEETATLVLQPSEDLGPGTIPPDQVEDREKISAYLNRVAEFLWNLERYDSGDSDNWKELLSEFASLTGLNSGGPKHD